MSVQMMNKWIKNYKIHWVKARYGHFQLQDSPFEWFSLSGHRNMDFIIIHYFLCFHLSSNKTLNPVDYYWNMSLGWLLVSIQWELPVSALTFSSLPWGPPSICLLNSSWAQNHPLWSLLKICPQGSDGWVWSEVWVPVPFAKLPA